MQQIGMGLAIFFGLLAFTPPSPGQTTEPYIWANAQVVGGGFVSGIIANPHFPVIYCRTDIGGAYRWDKPLNRWLPLTDWVDAEHWNYMGAESLATDPEDGNRVYIAAGMYTNAWAGNAAVLRSVDQGKTWKISPVPFKMGGNENGRNNGERLAVDPNDADVLYLGTRRAGLWKSVDAAAHWQRVSSFPAVDDKNGQGIVYIKFDEASGRRKNPTPTIYVAISTAATSFYRSTDAGQSWQTVPGAPSGLLPHKAAWDRDRCLYLTYGNAPGPNGVNNGAVWKFNAPNDQWTEITPVRPGGDDKFGYQGVTVDLQNPRTVMVSTLDRYKTGDDIFRSNDGGQTWKAIGPLSQRDFSLAPWLRFGKNPAPNQPIGHWIASVEIDPFDSNHAMFCTGWGIWTTNNLTDADRGGTVRWQVGAQGIEELVANKVISPPSGAPVLSAVWDVDGFRHDTPDRSPSAGMFTPEVGRNTSIDFAQLNPSVMARVYGGQILGHDFGKMTGGAVSQDGGITWNAFESRLGNDIDGEIAVSADGSTLVWAPQNGPVCFSNDLGKTWSPGSGVPAHTKVISDRVDPRFFYSFNPTARTIYKSIDGGRQFTLASQNLPRGKDDFHAVPGRSGDLWLATDTGLFHSIDGGVTFSAVAGVRKAYNVGFGKAATGSDYPAIYFTGRLRQGDGETEYGFYRSDDQGNTWVRINDNAHQFGLINSITGDPRIFGRLYVASDNRGILYGQPAGTDR